MNIKDALNAIKTGNVLPVYFLKGNDHFLQSFFIERVSNIFFQDMPVDKTLMLPDDMKGKAIIDQLTVNDLFATKKLFILRNPQQLRGRVIDDLLDYCKSPQENHILILIHDDWIIKSKFLTQLQKLTNSVDVQTPFKTEMKKWANFFLKEKSKRADPLIVDNLIEIAGDSLGHLNNEIEKVCIWASEKDLIEKTDIERFTGWKRERQRWEFLLALGSRDLKNSILLGKSIISANETMVTLIYPLTSMFTELLLAKYENGTFSGSSGYVPLPPSIKKKIPQFSRKFNETELESSLEYLGHIDQRQKTQFSNDETDLIQFILHVIG